MPPCWAEGLKVTLPRLGRATSALSNSSFETALSLSEALSSRAEVGSLPAPRGLTS